MGNVSNTYVSGTGNKLTINNKQRAAASLGATGKSLSSHTAGNDLDEFVDASFAEALAACQTELYHMCNALGTSLRIPKGSVTKMQAMTKREAINHQTMLLKLVRDLHGIVMSADDAFMARVEKRFETPDAFDFDPTVIEGAYSRAETVDLLTPELALAQAEKARSTGAIRAAIDALGTPADPSRVRAKSELVQACGIIAEPCGTFDNSPNPNPLKLVTTGADVSYYPVLAGLGSMTSGADLTIVSGGTVDVEPYDGSVESVNALDGSRVAFAGAGVHTRNLAGGTFREISLKFTEPSSGSQLTYHSAMSLLDLSAQKQSTLGRLMRHGGDSSDIRMTLDGVVTQRGFVASGVGIAPVGIDSATGVATSYVPGETFIKNGTTLIPTCKALGRQKTVNGTLVVCKSARQINLDARGEYATTILTCLPCIGTAKLSTGASRSAAKGGVGSDAPLIYSELAGDLGFQHVYSSACEDVNGIFDHFANNVGVWFSPQIGAPAAPDSVGVGRTLDSLEGAKYVVQSQTYDIDWHIRARLTFAADEGVYAFIIPDPSDTPFTDVPAGGYEVPINNIECATYVPVPGDSRLSIPFYHAVSGTTRQGEHACFSEFVTSVLTGTFRAETRNHEDPPMWMVVMDEDGVPTYKDAEVVNLPGQTPIRSGMAYSAQDGLLDAIPTLGNINPRYFSSLLTQAEWHSFYLWARSEGNRSVGYKANFVDFCCTVLFPSAENDLLRSYIKEDLTAWERS